MKHSFLAAVLLGAAAILALGAVPTAVTAQAVVDVPPEYRGSSNAIPGRYIVVFKDHVANPAVEARSMMRGRGGEIHHTYSHTIRGFAASIPDAAYQALRRNPNVAYIEQDITMYPGTTTQTNATWGLDRIDQRSLPRDGLYHYDYTGRGVTAYVIDSGINYGHVDFGNRAIPGFDAFPNEGLNGGDCNGHGTHVAGTIGGATWGVAKAVTLVSVRVFGCSGGTAMSTVIGAVDWITDKGSQPAVVNMSLGGGYAQALNDAVTASVNAGFVYTVSAGNEGRDACGYSPASTAAALTVGATQSDDNRARYSNIGDCVDLFAPGSSITSTWIGSASATNTISGTSMSAPHVAGVAALLLQQQPTATPAEVGSAIMNGATQGIVGRARSANNNLLYSLVTIDGDSGVDDPPPGDGDDPGDGDGDPGGDGPLSGSATKNGPSWTATVTLTGTAGDATTGSTSGSWSTGVDDGCEIVSGDSSCSFSISNANRVSSVTYTDLNLGSVTINKP